MKLFTYVLCVAAAVSAFAVQAYTARRQPPLPLGTPIASLAPTGAGAAAAEAPARSTDARGKAVRAAGIAPTPDD
ncbi:MAG: hypothetical protein FJX77_09955, partial [Armatimonadetes bacterium]|nr:hypothetical protein [Armatimonadota bacterium]